MKQLLFFMKQLHRLQGPVIYMNQLGMGIMGLIEGLGVLLLIPLIQLTGFFQINGLSKFNNSKLAFLTRFFHLFNPTINLILILVLFLVLMNGQNIIQRQQSILNSRIQQQFLRKLKEDTYEAILQSDWNFFIRHRKSDLANVVLVEIQRVGAGTYSFLQFLSSLMITCVQLAIAIYISVKMTIFVLIFGAILLVCSRTFIRKSKSLGERTVQLSRTYMSGVTDQLNGIKDIKSNSLELSHLSWFKSISEKIENNIIELTRLRMSSQFVYKCASSLLIAGFLYLSIQFFKAQPAQLMLIIAIFSRLWPRVSSIQNNLEQLSANLPSFNYLIEIQKECQQSREIRTEIQTDFLKPLHISTSIEYSQVYFKYDTSEKGYALENINLKLPANRMTAIVGRSGAGKSTLIDILMGLNRPQKGELLIDGIPLNDELLLTLRKSISYVPQDPFVFNASIRENLTIVKSDATDEELWVALEFASAKQFVHQLPHKLETLIGDRGTKLSGGEKQRLVLARAMLKQPSILILDEATSSLDSENESNIQDALDRINGKLTLIVIAHRLSTIRNADKVIVLDEGRIVQQGRYLQLAEERRGVFGQLLARQVELKSTTFSNY